MANFGCYLPAGEARPAYRILGSHLGDDSPEMLTAASLFAGSLLDALGLDTGAPERILIGPARYSDRILAQYCAWLQKPAFGLPGADLISPALVPYLLGGIPIKTVEKLAHRALEVMEFFPSPLKVCTLPNALALVGFGARPHIHHDVEAVKRYNHLSRRQEYLLELPRTGSYARLLIDHGAYAASTREKIAKLQPDIIHEVERLLDPDGGEMGEFAAEQRAPVKITPLMFNRAVRRVFEKPWADLDLRGDQQQFHHDAEVLIARELIKNFASADKMSAQTLVGISLLTGVSIANWTEFAVYDLRRRGETFITAEAIEEAIAIAEVSPHFRCGEAMYDAATQIKFASTEKAAWARRLRSTRQPLWSTNGLLYQSGRDSHGLPTFKHKPYRVSED
jgi:hypothetical protein